MFKLNNNGLIDIDPELLLIPEFSNIWKSDTSINKTIAYSKLSFIYFMCDYKSPYNNYGAEKETHIIRDFFRDESINLKTPDIEAAINKYNELKKIPEVHVLEASRELMFKVADYMKSVKLSSVNFLAATSALSNVSKTIASYSQVKESVEKELGKTSKKLGSSRIGSRER